MYDFDIITVFFSKLSFPLTFTIDSSAEIQDSYFDVRFRLQHALWALIRSLVFNACFGTRHFGLQFKFWGNFGFEASRSSTASVFAFGL